MPRFFPLVLTALLSVTAATSPAPNPTLVSESIDVRSAPSIQASSTSSPRYVLKTRRITGYRYINGTQYGYIKPVLNAKGFYHTFQSAQAGALEVSFSYSPDASGRLNLRPLNGPSAAPGSTFPFFGGSDRSGQSPTDAISGELYVHPSERNDTPPSGFPRVFSSDTSYHAVTGGGETYVESPIWRYNPAAHSLTAQWINPDGTEPKTYLVFVAKDVFDVTGAEDPPSLVLAGDVEAMRGNDG
ncbi:hypothetical protein C8R44DRAFT_858594 [Mycena epipterygia]|nr:hypothetical protein C8R44DRAFT_858594 [Mycena epipterygia]